MVSQVPQNNLVSQVYRYRLNWVGCELEPRFVELGNKNLAMHAPRWAALESACSVKLLQGDSRRFAEVVGKVAGVVSSPPYAHNEKSDRRVRDHEGNDRDQRRGFRQGQGCFRGSETYGTTEGQIGDLKSGDLDAVISSPPYAEGLGHGGEYKEVGAGGHKNKRGQVEGYGNTAGQIGSLKSGSLDGVVTSPPFEAQMNQGGAGKTQIYRKWCEQNGRDPNAANAQTQNASKQWGDSPEQMGNLSGETYWQAMHAVYSSMRDAMKPGGVAAIVIKDYVSKKARVPLCNQTCTLLESLGFEVFERCRCWLVKETREPSLFGGEHVTTTERKSFFRRLAEKKGSPRIDWEEAIWCRRKS